ncbi:MAG: DUF2147 domain-containing protein [Sulfitobacter sp.]
MNLLKLLFSYLIFASLPVLSLADVPVGLWEAKPDRRGVVVHVRTKPCGGAICGRIERAKDRRGYDTPSTDLGRRMLLNMQAQSDGSYTGKVWEPVGNRMLTAKMRVRGNMMELNTCDGDACANVVWTRLR